VEIWPAIGADEKALALPRVMTLQQRFKRAEALPKRFWEVRP
jgi:hypothetical protein